MNRVRTDRKRVLLVSRPRFGLYLAEDFDEDIPGALDLSDVGLSSSHTVQPEGRGRGIGMCLDETRGRQHPD